MKKTIFSLFAFISALSISAQDLVPTHTSGIDDIADMRTGRSYVISIGPKAGLNYSIAGDPEGVEAGIGGAMGFNAGVAANIHFGYRKLSSPGGTGWFGLQVEALFAQRTLSTNSENIKMSCVEIPVLAQLYLTPNFCIEAGPTFSTVLSSSPSKLEVGNFNYGIEEMKSSDVMLTLGLGYKSKNGLSFGARYNMGNSDLAGNFSTKVSTVSFNIAWLFSVVK